MSETVELVSDKKVVFRETAREVSTLSSFISAHDSCAVRDGPFGEPVLLSYDRVYVVGKIVSTQAPGVCTLGFGGSTMTISGMTAR
jgi:hypothetical protein